MKNDVLDTVVERAVLRHRTTAEGEARRLMEAGLSVMRRTGSLDPRVSDIVKEARLSNQAFYRHFQSKDELLLAIMAEGRQALVAFLDRRMAGTDDPVERARRWIEGVLAQARNAKAADATRPFAVNAGRLAHLFPEETAASAEALKRPLVAALTDAGSADPERDADALYHLAMGCMERHLVHGTAPRPTDVDHLVGVALYGVLGGGRPA